MRLYTYKLHHIIRNDINNKPVGLVIFPMSKKREWYKNGIKVRKCIYPEYNKKTYNL